MPEVANEITSDRLAPFMTRISRAYEDLASEQGSYMARCRTIREGIAGALDEAKDAGIPKKEFKAAIKKLQLQVKMDRVRENLEPDEQPMFDQIITAVAGMEDLPLGLGAVHMETQARERRRAGRRRPTLVEDAQPVVEG